MPNPTPDQLRAYVQKASRPKPIRLEVDGYGTAFVRVQTAYHQDMVRKKLDTAKKDDHCDMGRLLAAMLCDADGNSIYDIDNDEHVKELAELPAYVTEAMLDASNKANSKNPKT